MNAYFELVEKLSQVGARNYLFINVPPMERSPLFLALPASNQSREKAFINVYNSRLKTRIDWFSGNHSDVQLWEWDAHAAFTRILDNPTAYGFKDATSYGNNDPNYLWSGNYHPSSAAYRIFAEEISYVLSGSVWW
ncbi:hypothetical protein F5887DRAFT_1117929 [Amanita rubescens]|nr:hypothetical protein F5887DRAFT_1117929 [Amanita rubescens]